MCWSADVSLKTWILTTILSIAMKSQTDPKVWLLLTIFSQIQLAEYFIWKDLNNVYASMFALIILLLEPVASINLLKSTELRNKLWLVYGVLMMAFMLMSKKIDFTNEVGKDGHLVWNWFNFGPLFAIIWGLMFLVPILLAGYHKTFVAALLVMIYSRMNYIKYDTHSSMWCWFSVFFWVLAPFSK